jgi:hypothetical protein
MVFETLFELPFIVDQILTFFIPDVSGDGKTLTLNFLGEFVFNRKAVAKRYLTFWFWFDTISNIPYTFFKFYMRDPYDSDMMNFLTFNLAYTPRVYTVCLGLKLFRIRKAKQHLLMLLKDLKFGVESRGLAITIWTIVLILHIISCFWGAIGTFNYESNENWIVFTNNQDKSSLELYMTSLYFASIITMTVGYGDILP